jgi:thiol:disulfide interchange protein DsbA
MIRRTLASLALLLPLVACSPSPSTSDTTAPAATAPAAETPAAAPAAAEASTAPAADTSTPAAAPAATPAPAAPAPMTAADAPRLGTDYDLLSTPQPTFAPAAGKIEIDEVFSYRCIHCAEFQPSVNAWEKTMPADVHWVYVPAAFGGAWDDFARAFYAAEIMGVRERTHDMVFKGIFEDSLVKTGTPEEIADMYGKFGVDRNTFLATMQSFGVTAKLNRSRQFALRNGVEATPTIILNGKYRVSATRDRGFEGMLKTVDFLIAQERAAGATH